MMARGYTTYVTETSPRVVDPRVRRTRDLLQQALRTLLETRDFESLSVQDITEAATLNRATFYDHYPDKFALLECMVAGRFHQLMAARGVRFDGNCSSAFKAIVLAVCDYLAAAREKTHHLEPPIIAVVREMILDGLQRHPSGSTVPAELVAATITSAIYGGAKEWMRMPDRCSSEQISDILVKLVLPIYNSLSNFSAS